MRSRILYPVLLFAVAGFAGWFLIWRMSEVSSGPKETEPEPEPLVAAPPIKLAPAPPPKTAEPTEPVPIPTPPQPVIQPAMPSDTPEPPANDDTNSEAIVPPEERDPREILKVPAHLEDKSEEEQQQYFVQLHTHHKHMIQYARANIEKMRENAETDLQREQVDNMERQIDLAQKQYEVLKEYLIEEGLEDQLEDPAPEGEGQAEEAEE